MFTKYLTAVAGMAGTTALATVAGLAVILGVAGCSSGQAGSPAASSTSGGPTAVMSGSASGMTTVAPAAGATVARAATPFTSATAVTPSVPSIDPDAWKAQVIARVSVPADGGEGDNWSGGGRLSVDGRYVMFTSAADNLVPGDTNVVTKPGQTYGPGVTEPPRVYNATDVFVLDRQTGSLERVSVASDGTQGNDNSGGVAISADGRYALFLSGADNLVPGDTNEAEDAFVHDRQTGVTERVSLAGDGSQAGRGGYPRAMSADGRYVLFDSNSADLVAGDTNEVGDLFLHDRQTGATERVNLATGGEQADGPGYSGAMSSDGRFVVFQSPATNLVPGDTNGKDDIFVRDREKGTTERVSVSSSGRQGNQSSYGGSVSADGRYVAFDSDASNLVRDDRSSLRRDVFVFDRRTKTTERVSVGPSGEEAGNASGSATISADGRWVLFRSYAGNLVPGDANRKDDIFVRDLEAGTTRLLSLSTAGDQQDTECTAGSISGDGAWVTFTTRAGNLVPGDTNELEDVFVVKASR